MTTVGKVATDGCSNLPELLCAATLVCYVGIFFGRGVRNHSIAVSYGEKCFQPLKYSLNIAPCKVSRARCFSCTRRQAWDGHDQVNIEVLSRTTDV